MPIFGRRKAIGPILLGVWLVAHGVLGLVTVKVPYLSEILAILAIAAGVLILIEK
jgi:hypothetical protein